MTLTIGMATFDDYEGVYFTIQSLRMFHPILNTIDYEIIVQDNNPSSSHGKLCRQFIESSVPNGRYIEYTDRQTSFSKYNILNHAKGDIYLGIDCHVLLVSGFFDNLLKYYESNPLHNNLIQGPLFIDNLKDCFTEMKPEWRGNMFGTWFFNKELFEKNEPFEITLQGMGMFSCLTKQFPSIEQSFLHFGGEEGYIHEKFRKNGGKCLCHPGLGWVHRFNRPHPLPYTNTYESIYRNYFIAWNSLEDEKFINDMNEYFNKYLSKDKMKEIRESVLCEYYILEAV